MYIYIYIYIYTSKQGGMCVYGDPLVDIISKSSRALPILFGDPSLQNVGERLEQRCFSEENERRRGGGANPCLSSVFKSKGRLYQLWIMYKANLQS